MQHPLEAGTIRIVKPDGSTAGAGFIISKRLAVTCMHVVESAGAKQGGEVKFEYHLKHPETNEKQNGIATVLEAGWSKGNDVAVLEMKGHMPSWVKPLVLKGSYGTEGSKFHGLGYPDNASTQMRWAEGSIRGRVEVKDFVDPVLQIQGDEIEQGFSGSAIVEQSSRRVIGMLTAYQDLARPATSPKVRIGYIIPTESIWNVYPAIQEEAEQRKPYTPILNGVDQLPNDYARLIQKFLTDYLGTPKQPEPFGGREDSFEALNKWLESDTQRLLLASPAGRGKSALLVRWIDSLILRDDLALVFFPISIRYRTNLASTFFASLAARLAYLHEEPISTNVETSRETYHNLVNQYLRKPLPNNRKLVVVLDGLDEAADWEVSFDLLPADLPPNTHIVVSARFLRGDADSRFWLKRLGWDRKGIAITLDVNPLDIEGVSDVLRRMGFPLNELSQRVNIISELHRLSEGDPLMINLYVEDLWERGETAARLEPEDLYKIKTGIDGYFENWWEDQKLLWGGNALNLEKGTKLVFNLLCSAFGPLTKDDILSLTKDDGIDTYIIEEALETLKRFVIGIPTDHKHEIGYVLTHPKLRDFFWGKLSEAERTTISNRYLLWGERVLQELISEKLAPNGVPDYLLQYYCMVLEKKKAPIEKFLPIIEFPQWHQAWYEYEGSYSGYLNDVRQIWKICSEINETAVKEDLLPSLIDKEIRCLLIEASLHNIAQNIPSDLLTQLAVSNKWSFSRVLAYIKQIPDLEIKTSAIRNLIAITPFDFTEDILNIGVSIADAWYRDITLVNFAEFLREEQLYLLVDMVPSLEFESNKFLFLLALVNRLPIIKLDTLMLYIQERHNEKELAKLYCALARRSPDKYIEEAIVATLRVQNPLERFMVIKPLILDSNQFYSYKTIVALYAQDGNLSVEGIVTKFVQTNQDNPIQDYLFNLIKNVEPETLRAEFLSLLAQKNLLILNNEVIEIALSIQNESGRILALISMFKVATENQKNDIIRNIYQIDDDLLRASALGAIIKFAPKSLLDLLYEEFFYLVDHIQGEWEKMFLLNSISVDLPDVQLPNYFKSSMKITHGSNRINALLGVLPRLSQSDFLLVLDNVKMMQPDSQIIAYENLFPVALLKFNKNLYIELISAIEKAKASKSEVLSRLSRKVSDPQRDFLVSEAVASIGFIGDELNYGFFTLSLFWLMLRKRKLIEFTNVLLKLKVTQLKALKKIVDMEPEYKIFIPIILLMLFMLPFIVMGVIDFLIKIPILQLTSTIIAFSLGLLNAIKEMGSNQIIREGIIDFINFFPDFYRSIFNLYDTDDALSISVALFGLVIFLSFYILGVIRYISRKLEGLNKSLFLYIANKLQRLFPFPYKIVSNYLLHLINKIPVEVYRVKIALFLKDYLRLNGKLLVLRLSDNLKDEALKILLEGCASSVTILDLGYFLRQLKRLTDEHTRIRIIERLSYSLPPDAIQILLTEKDMSNKELAIIYTYSIPRLRENWIEIAFDFSKNLPTAAYKFDLILTLQKYAPVDKLYEISKEAFDLACEFHDPYQRQRAFKILEENFHKLPKPESYLTFRNVTRKIAVSRLRKGAFLDLMNLYYLYFQFTSKYLVANIHAAAINILSWWP